jgi:hypothetical protein
MSSTSNRPYKSRFFNFLNRHAIRLRDRGGIAWRKAAQTSVEWGVQILLYPVYLVVQIGRFARRQLQQTIADVPRFTASRLNRETQGQAVDLLFPTERVLEALQPTVSREETPSGNLFPRLDIHLLNPKDPLAALRKSSALAVLPSDSSSVPQALQIQGVVSLLNSHRLAVVTEENVVLDLLGDEQQKILENQIHVAIANYWYERKRLYQAQRRTPGLMPSFRKTWPNVLPPVRWFWGIMRWEQTSDIAREIDLFGESSLVPLDSVSDELVPSVILQGLDEKLAAIEEQDLVSLTQWLQRSLMQQPTELAESPPWKIQVLMRAAVDYFFGLSRQMEISPGELPPTLPGVETGQKIFGAIKERGSQWLYVIGDRINDRLPDQSADPESDPFQIQVFIKSALEYYLAREAAPIGPQEPAKALPEAGEPDPWLSWQDLFAPPTEIHQTPLPKPISALPAAETPSKLPQPEIKPQKNTGVRPKNATKPQKIATVAVNSVSFEAKQPTDIVPPPFPTSYELPPDSTWPDWVETQATSAGYEKHILERILDWFDRIVLWIEESIVKIWQLFQSKKRNRKRGQR